MSLFDVFKKKGKGAAPVEKQELSPTEKFREASVASGREIVNAIDALLFSMRSAKKYPQLSEENIADLTERFNNIQKVLSGTHSDFDVSELDGKILSLVKGLESQIAEDPMESWDKTLSRLNGAVMARIKSEYEIRLAALDMAELFLEHTNAAWQRQIAALEATKKETSNEVEQLKQDEMIIGTRKNLLVNVQRLEEIRSLRLQLQTDRVSPSEGVVRDIEKLLASIRTATPEFMKIAQLNAEAIRQKTIDTKVVVEKMQEVNQQLQDALDAAEMQAKAQSVQMKDAATVVQSVQESEAKRDREAIAD